MDTADLPHSQAPKQAASTLVMLNHCLARSLSPSWALILLLPNLICYLTNFLWKCSLMKNLGRGISRTVLQVNLRRMGASGRSLYLAPPQALPIYAGKCANFDNNKYVGHLRVLNEKLKAFMRSLYKAPW